MLELIMSALPAHLLVLHAQALPQLALHAFQVTTYILRNA